LQVPNIYLAGGGVAGVLIAPPIWPRIFASYSLLSLSFLLSASCTAGDGALVQPREAKQTSMAASTSPCRKIWLKVDSFRVADHDKISVKRIMEQFLTALLLGQVLLAQPNVVNYLISLFTLKT
jgi:hypothetical protein